MSFLYNNIAIPLASFLIKIMKPFNKKLAVRENSWKESLHALNGLPAGTKRIWFHAASMGEFEQAKPVIEKIRGSYKDITVIVSFFSPSGYDNQKDYPLADAVVYLPFDILKNVRYFLDDVSPNIAVFVRYEIWRNFLGELRNRNIPAYLICATRPNSGLMNSIILRQFTRNNYNYFSEIFTVGKEHTDFFDGLGVESKVTTLSDTRFDRIIENIRKSREKKLLSGSFFPEEDFIIVLGSSWKPDEDIMFPAVERLKKESKRNIRMIIVPHEPTKEHIENIRKRLPETVLLSSLTEKRAQQKSMSSIKEFVGENHLLVDSIGKLLSLYRHAHIAYVGGAFGAGVHSVTEPAGYGIPVACGPGYKNSPDAPELKKTGALEILKNEKDCYSWIKKYLESDAARKKTGRIAGDYVNNARGSSDKISKIILRELNSQDSCFQP